MNFFSSVALFENEQRSMLDRFSVNFFLSVLGAGTLLAAWLLAQDAAKKVVVDNITQAANSGNIYVLNKAVDWNSVRDNMKQDILNNHHNEMVGLPNQPQEVEKLVNYYVRPDNVPVLLSMYKKVAPTIDTRSFVHDVRFSGIREITMEIAAPPQLDKPWINRLHPVEMVLLLEPTGWKLKRIRPPEYMIPTRIPGTSAKTGA